MAIHILDFRFHRRDDFLEHHQSLDAKKKAPLHSKKGF
jgi:hypothetical protein